MEKIKLYKHYKNRASAKFILNFMMPTLWWNFDISVSERLAQKSIADFTNI
jgi:hypothetical protein